ncbi:unnamed protein product [Cuscuta epithymum]|uniref:Uncharacterized protein n=1 Tax=Cuscuta epithymum TaxID=186058 RepID=A0AAV0G6B2_9ASTE|nr:unnamed protein product [Cuscuta epithymum]
MKLTRAVSHGRAVVIDIAHEHPAANALDPGPLPLDAPVIQGLEEGFDLILLLEAQFGRIDGGEGEGAFVSGLKVEIRWEELSCVEVEIGFALFAAVDGRHGRW